MNRKVIFGLVLGAAALALIGRRRRSSLALGGAVRFRARSAAVNRCPDCGAEVNSLFPRRCAKCAAEVEKAYKRKKKREKRRRLTEEDPRERNLTARAEARRRARIEAQTEVTPADVWPSKRKKRRDLTGLAAPPKGFRPDTRKWMKGAAIERKARKVSYKAALRIARERLYENPDYYRAPLLTEEELMRVFRTFAKEKRVRKEVRKRGWRVHKGGKTDGLAALGWPAVRHAIFRSTLSGATLVHLMAAERYAKEGDCKRAVYELQAAEYASGKASAHAEATADEGTQKSLAPGQEPRIQYAQAKKVRKEVHRIRDFVAGECVFVKRSRRASDPRQGKLL